MRLNAENVQFVAFSGGRRGPPAALHFIVTVRDAGKFL